DSRRSNAQTQMPLRDFGNERAFSFGQFDALPKAPTLFRFRNERGDLAYLPGADYEIHVRSASAYFIWAKLRHAPADADYHRRVLLFRLRENAEHAKRLVFGLLAN